MEAHLRIYVPEYKSGVVGEGAGKGGGGTDATNYSGVIVVAGDNAHGLS